MDIKEIIERPSPAMYTLEEMSYAIEKYIEKKTNKQVKINIFKNMSNIQDMNPWGIFMLQKEYQNIFNAFEIVQKEFFNDNKN